MPLRRSADRAGALLLIQMFPQFLAIVAIFLMFSTITDLYPRSASTPWGLILLYLGGASGSTPG